VCHDADRRSFALLLAAVFLIFLPIGFLTNVGAIGGNSPARR
jgi:hypothetical protein